MDRRVLNDKEIEEALSELSGWQVTFGKLSKTFQFDSFAEALGWMVSVGVNADKMDHHPEWSNVYNKVMVQLVTHDMDDSISTWDIELARKMDQLAG